MKGALYTMFAMGLLVGCEAPVEMEDGWSELEALEQADAVPDDARDYRGGGGPIFLDPVALVAGEVATLTITAADPGERVAFVVGTNGIGAGPCPPALGGLCLDLAVPASKLPGLATADFSGLATYAYTVPSAPGRELCFQAAVKRGPGGADSVVSGVECAEIQEPDTGFDESQWYFGNYPGSTGFFNPNIQWNGDINCPDTCGALGLTAHGARFICNTQFPGGPAATEGCDASNDGEYGDDNCGWAVVDDVETTISGNTEDCATYTGTSMLECVTGFCGDTVTYHALECQCY